MITIVFPFAPVAKGRPRLGKGFVFTPMKTRRFESDIKLWASKYKPKQPLKGPLKITARFFIKPPKKRTNEYPITRPDIDNYIKSLFDPLNELIWEDDSQIVKVDAEKFYDLTNAGPRITLLIEEMK